MAYDVHITRAQDWVDSASAPIRQDEWQRVVEADASLSLSPHDTFTRLVNGTQQTVQGFVWSAHPSGEPVVLWSVDGEIVSKEPDQATLRKLIAIARKLDARVLGDDGEHYDLDRDDEITLDGQVLASKPQPAPSWRTTSAWLSLLVMIATAIWLATK